MLAEDYIHRIGRTGRNGATGEALSLVSPEEGALLRDIQKVLKAEIEMQVVRGFEPSRPIRLDVARPPNGGQARGRGNGKPAGQQPLLRAASKPADSAHGKPDNRSDQPQAGPKQHRGGAGKPQGARSGTRA